MQSPSENRRANPASDPAPGLIRRYGSSRQSIGIWPPRLGLGCVGTRRPRRRRRSPPAYTWPRQRKARLTASRSQRGSRRLSLRRIANEQLSKSGSTDESTGTVHIGHARGEGKGNVEKRASSTEAGSDGSTPRAKASSSRSASASRTSSTAASRPSPEFKIFDVSFTARVIVARSYYSDSHR